MSSDGTNSMPIGMTLASPWVNGAATNSQKRIGKRIAAIAAPRLPITATAEFQRSPSPFSTKPRPTTMGPQILPPQIRKNSTSGDTAVNHQHLARQGVIEHRRDGHEEQDHARIGRQ